MFVGLNCTSIEHASMNPARLVFCGGGTRCTVFLHALVELERNGRLSNVREYWGTSAGALVASLYALSKSATTLKTVMYSIDYTKFRDMDVSNLFSITSSWGLDDGSSLVREVERIFEQVEPGAKHKVLRDVPELNIVVSDLNLRETVVCNAVNFPTLRVTDAIRASMSLPIFFRPFINPVNGHYWVDGAVRANFPWAQLPSDEARRESLGFTFEKHTDDGPKTFMEYVFSMIHFDEPKKFKQLKQTWASNILFFPSPPFPPWFLRLKPADYELLEKVGTSVARDWLLMHPASSAGTPEIRIASSHPRTRSFSPVGRKIGLMDSLIPSPEPSRDSSQPQSLRTGLSCRRWSV